MEQVAFTPRGTYVDQYETARHDIDGPSRRGQNAVRHDIDGDLIDFGSPDKSAGKVVICPFTVIVDTREQSPFSFRGIKGDSDQAGRTYVVPTERATLATGDYSIAGFEDQITIERKSHSDLYGTMIRELPRFIKEFERMRTYRFSAVVVEADWARIITPPVGSKANGKSISRGIMSLQLRYPSTQWMTAPDRRWAEIWTFQVLRKFFEHRLRETKEAEKAAKRSAAKVAAAGTKSAATTTLIPSQL